MSNEDKELSAWETLPARAGEAFAVARARAIAAGQRIVESRNGVIHEFTDDGASQVVKRIDPPLRVTKGKVITLK